MKFSGLRRITRSFNRLNFVGGLLKVILLEIVILLYQT